MAVALPLPDRVKRKFPPDRLKVPLIPRRVPVALNDPGTVIFEAVIATGPDAGMVSPLAVKSPGLPP